MPKILTIKDLLQLRAKGKTFTDGSAIAIAMTPAEYDEGDGDGNPLAPAETPEQTAIQQLLGSLDLTEIRAELAKVKAELSDLKGAEELPDIQLNVKRGANGLINAVTVTVDDNALAFSVTRDSQQRITSIHRKRGS